MALGALNYTDTSNTAISTNTTKRKRRRRRHGAKRDEQVAAELQEVNEILQDDERSQQETWQIGKRLKKIMETHPQMAKRQTIDAFFLWGTALARLASQNEDATLAHAAADKFQEMHELSGGDDAAVGAVGYSLWASSLLIMATEEQSKDVLDQALDKFQQAVDVDGGTTFETRFQFARALKEGGDMVKFLEEEADTAAAVAAATQTEDGTAAVATVAAAAGRGYRQYYERALALCVELETICQEESGKDVTVVEQSSKEEEEEDDDDEEEEDEGEEDGEIDDDAFDSEEEEVDPEDDVVNVTDLAEVKLLEAMLHGVLEEDATESEARAHVDRTLAFFQKAMALDPENPGVLLELANYVAMKGKQRQTNRALDSVSWETTLDSVENQFTMALQKVGFAMSECKEICFRKDTQQEEEPEDEDARTDAQVPHLLHALGKALVSYLCGEAAAAGSATGGTGTGGVKKATLAELKKMGKIQGASGVKGGVKGGAKGGGFLSKMKGKLSRKTCKSHPRFEQAIQVLRAAHHFHDKLGCYPLACLFANPLYQDEAQCKMWLETAETYGVLDEELQLDDFQAWWEKPWFVKYTQPAEVVVVDEEEERVEEKA